MPLWLLVTLIAATACTLTPPTPITSRYAAAVRDAAQATPEEVVSTLVAIRSDNDALQWNQERSRIKVVTWKSRQAYESYLLPNQRTAEGEGHVIWVTPAPRIQEFCQQYRRLNPTATQGDLELRLKQRLGLAPGWSYDLFVELWVSPSDIIRPCVDPDPSDTTCELNFGATTPQVKNIADYPRFFKNLYFNDFRGAPGVPWTGLGYTYDWINPQARPSVEVGESEFILAPDTPYVIDRAVPTESYCRP